MKALEILKEELSKEGLNAAEEAVIKIVEVIDAKVLPRLALEADEQAVKAIAGVAIPVFKALKPALLKSIDKIDGEEG